SQTRDQRLLASLVSFKDFRAESAGAVLGDSQLEFANPGYQPARVITTSVSAAVCASLALACSDDLFHLRFQNLLNDLLDGGFHHVLVRAEQLFPIQTFSLNLGSGHWFISFSSKLSGNNFLEIPWPFPISGPFCRRLET